MHSIIQQIEQNLILVEKGSFMMGDANSQHKTERPVHKMILKHDFYIGKYLVTQALWKTIMGRNSSRFKGENRPVESISWNEIQIFIDNLNKLVDGKYQYRLPTEAEWEYAARSGKNQDKFQYAGSRKLKEVAWYNKNTYKETKAVGLKFPNKLGLYDMCGNVWEWCEDKWHDNYTNMPTDGSAWLEGYTSSRVIRGGSWNYNFYQCRIAVRSYNISSLGSFHIGFRLSRY